MDNWINIKDQLPEQGVEVLVTAEINGDFTSIDMASWGGLWSKGDTIVMDYGVEDDWVPCTHWMPLPKLPNE